MIFNLKKLQLFFVIKKYMSTLSNKRIVSEIFLIVLNSTYLANMFGSER